MNQHRQRNNLSYLFSLLTNLVVIICRLSFITTQHVFTFIQQLRYQHVFTFILCINYGTVRKYYNYLLLSLDKLSLTFYYELRILVLSWEIELRRTGDNFLNVSHFIVTGSGKPQDETMDPKYRVHGDTLLVFVLLMR